MAGADFTVSCKVSWWVRPYLQFVGLFARLRGAQPDLHKVHRVVKRGVKVS